MMQRKLIQIYKNMPRGAKGYCSEILGCSQSWFPRLIKSIDSSDDILLQCAEIMKKASLMYENKVKEQNKENLKQINNILKK